jgi:hypothetical protein
MEAAIQIFLWFWLQDFQDGHESGQQVAGWNFSELKVQKKYLR